MKSSAVQGFVALLLTLGSASAHSHEQSHDQHHQLPLPATTACLNEVVRWGKENGVLSGIAAVVVLDGRIVYHHGFGTVGPATPQPVLPSTRFRIGSVTKMMTATAALSLVDEHRLRLHKPVTDVLPGFSLEGEPGWLEKLNLHLLLSHQGGINDTGDVHGPVDDGALEAAFYDPAFTSTVPFLVAPGTFWNYSNTNFMLAGLMAEKAAGKPFRVVMRQRVFKPLGMTRATFLTSEVTSDNDYALGIQDGVVYGPTDYDDAVERPSGMAWASVDDLAQFVKFILRGDRDVLPPRLWRALQTPQVSTSRGLDLESYGYGLMIEKSTVLKDAAARVRFYDGLKEVWHAGGVPGYQSYLAVLPEQQFGYAAIVNGDISDLDHCFGVASTETVGDRLPPAGPFPPRGIERARFVDYVGHYLDRINLAGPAVISLTPSGDLSMRLPDRDAEGFQYDPILEPVSRDTFLFHTEIGDLEFTGFREDGSPIVHMRTRLTVLTRTADAQAAQRAVARAPSDGEAFKRAVRAAAKELSPK